MTSKSSVKTLPRKQMVLQEGFFWSHRLPPGYACLGMGRPGSPSEGGRAGRAIFDRWPSEWWIQDFNSGFSRKLEENLKILFKSTVSYDASDLNIVGMPETIDSR